MGNDPEEERGGSIFSQVFPGRLVGRTFSLLILRRSRTMAMTASGAIGATVRVTTDHSRERIRVLEM